MVVSSAQRRARPAGRGSQAVAVGATVRSGEPRDKVLAELCDRHAGQLTAIDRLLQDLRGSETRLQAAVDADAAEAAQVGVARRGAEHIQADQAKRLAEAERELRDLLRDREAKEQQLASLDSDLHLLTGQQQASEREAQAVPAASGDESLLRTLRTLEEREQRVRELERQLLDAEDLRVHGSQALRSLLREHEDLSGIQGKYYQSVEQEMLDNQRVSDTLTRQLRELQVVRQSCCEMRRKAHEEKVRGEEYYAQLADVKAGLDTQLRRAQQQLRRAEESYAVATEDMFGPHAEPAQQLVRLEEMMMLLKATAISLWTDLEFIGEVNERASQVEGETESMRGLASFSDAFCYVREVLEEHHGALPTGERWGLKSVELPYDCVETLLSALKQLVTCYDMMSDAAKAAIPFSREIILNSRQLVEVTRESMRKYREIEHAREEEQAELDRAKEERKRERLARKFAPKVRDPYSRAPATGPPSLSSSPVHPPSLQRRTSPRACSASTSLCLSSHGDRRRCDDRPCLPLVSPIREER
eukprot:TRINITY_DN4313_c0_g1_i1.p1 TRINITY_DN4313_c0_g1~~TRINITY_DN4313_c0_g1_i1.p1  ORF type:complete len:532 (+),score=149.40 TRINITY_DN4313_c0_g1_i1:53-1648(+)